jgi:outer membrane protein assembly factor BamB
MSTVYAARDLRFGQVERICAVKEMFDLDPDANGRALRLVNFERESALLATITHPAVPKIYDYFIFNGLVYLVLEFIEGHDLERLLDQRKSPFTETALLGWSAEICSVLKTLHEQRPDPIIFRDLKPSNVMLRATGQIALVDFGIARTIQGRQRGTMIGTEGYAPPEQYRGIADARGDIYALGATLHHLATNADPRQETPFTFHERPVRSLNPEISEQFASVIAKMLAYNPSERYQTVHDILLDLHAIDSRQISMSIAPLDARATDQPAATANVHHPSPDGVDRPSETPTAVATAHQARRTGGKKRAIRRKRVDYDIIADRLCWAAQTLDEVRGSATFDGHSFIIGSYDGHVYAVTPVDGSMRWRFRTGRGVVARPAVNQSIAVIGSEDHSIYALDLETGRACWSHRTGMPVRSSAIILQDRTVVGSDDGSVYCLSLAEGKLLWKQRMWGPVRSSPVVCATTVLVGSDDGNLYALNAVNGRVNWRANAQGPIQSTPVIIGDLAIVTARSGIVSAFQIASGERLWQFDARAALLSSPRLAGGTLITGTVDGQLIGLSHDDGQHRWTSQIANQIVSSILPARELAYIGTIDGDVVAVHAATGEVAWRHSIGAAIVSTPAYGNGVIVVGATDGRVCGLSLTESEIEQLEVACETREG